MIDTLQEKQRFLGNFLERLANKIDLTETQQKTAVEKYDVIGRWLSAEDSPLAKFNPKIIPQGSFRTGLAVQPVNDKCGFDVDLTCILTGSLPEIQKALKEMVGKRLQDHCDRYTLEISEKRRCWRIHYSDIAGVSFHLDIVPALPDNYDWLTRQGVPIKYAQHAINITDIEAENYNYSSLYWQKSNTEGQSLWFLDTMKYNIHKLVRSFSKSVTALNEHVEDMPYFAERTPLQRGIQLMKRHRDIKYGDHVHKPISIIITTLAARAYKGVMDALEPLDFYEVLVRMVKAMPEYIENRNGIYWVPNPVNPSENFADKWQEMPIKSRIFIEWLNDFSAKLDTHTLNEGIHGLTKSFSNSFGETSVIGAVTDMGNATRISRENGSLKMASSGILGAEGIEVTKHLFHGLEGKK